MVVFKRYILFVFALGILSSCNSDFRYIGIHKDTRVEYAPNMYHSLAYEPLTQIVDSVNYPEYYNSNPYNPHGMTMREPVAGTINRNPKGFLPIHLHADSLAKAAQIANPIEVNDQVMAQGKLLYIRNCSPCHGAGGQGDGKVGERYGGVPNFASDALRNISGGHIFHVITFGKGRMTSYASQLNQEDRWKVAHYIRTLQKAE